MTGVVRPSDIAGRGPGIVLIHAGIADARMWDPQWNLLARDHRVLRLDLGGFGRAVLEPGPLCHAADVLATMDRADMPSATIVGASMGGAVAIDLAVAHPERVEALVLVGSALGGRTWSDDLRAAWDAEWAALEAGDLDGAAAQVVRLWVDGPGRPEGTAPADVRALVMQMQRRAYELQLPLDGQVDETELAPDAHERLHELTMPALVVDGAEDVPDFREIARHLAAVLPNARAATIADAAHLPSLERPDAFDDVLLEFLLGD